MPKERNKRTKLDAAIFVNLIKVEGKILPQFIDNGGNVSDPKHLEKFDTLVSDCGAGRMFWFAGAGVNKIEILIDEDKYNIVDDLRRKNHGQHWTCRITSCKPETSFKYSIYIKPLDGGDPIIVDPSGTSGAWPV